MPRINVVKPFILQLDPPIIGVIKAADGTEIKQYGAPEKLSFVHGAYDVPDDVANHWYTKAHLAGYEPPPPAPGTHQFAQEALLAAQGVRMMQPVAQQGQPPAPLPDDVKVMQRAGEVPADAHYFAGARQVDKPLPTDNTVKPPGEPQTQRSDTSLLGSQPAATKGRTKGG